MLNPRPTTPTVQDSEVRSPFRYSLLMIDVLIISYAFQEEERIEIDLTNDEPMDYQRTSPPPLTQPSYSRHFYSPPPPTQPSRSRNIESHPMFRPSITSIASSTTQPLGRNATAELESLATSEQVNLAAFTIRNLRFEDRALFEGEKISDEYETLSPLFSGSDFLDRAQSSLEMRIPNRSIRLSAATMDDLKGKFFDHVERCITEGNFSSAVHSGLSTIWCVSLTNYLYYLSNISLASRKDMQMELA